MNIFEATTLALHDNKTITKADRTDQWELYVGAGTVYRNVHTGLEVALDARDVLGTDWCVKCACNNDYLGEIVEITHVWENNRLIYEAHNTPDIQNTLDNHGCECNRIPDGGYPPKCLFCTIESILKPKDGE